MDAWQEEIARISDKSEEVITEDASAALLTSYWVTRYRLIWRAKHATEDSRACERRSWKQADILSIYIPLCGLVGDRFGYKQYARAARLASYFNFQKFLLCFDSMEIMHAV